jgi:hypothetical protein
VTVVVLSAVVPTWIAQRFFQPPVREGRQQAVQGRQVVRPRVQVAEGD